MTKDFKILALIAARGGSKRLPRKNVKLLGSKPLIKWTIDTAMGITDICDLLVSTDDDEIFKIAKNAGALVPWLRPSFLATDEATSADVCLHALNWYENCNGPVDGLLLLQPTSPFRSRETIVRGIETFKANADKSVIGMTQSKFNPKTYFYFDNSQLRQVFTDNNEIDMNDSVLVVNGAFYAINPESLRSSKTFFTENIEPLVINDLIESIDIDNKSDWEFAELICNNINR